MFNILLVIHIFVAIAMVCLILLQRSSEGGLGLGGGGGSLSGLMSVRGTTNLLSRATAILAALFMLNCLVMTMLARSQTKPLSILDETAAPAKSAPATPEKKSK